MSTERTEPSARADASPGVSPRPEPAGRESNRNRRRTVVLQAALSVIAERGLDEAKMTEIGQRAGMSAGHVMYYFPTKAKLLMEALAWSEDRFMTEAEAAIAPLDSARDRLRCLIEVSVPSNAADPAWILWLEAWAHAPHDATVARFQRAVDKRWLNLLARVTRQGRSNGEFPDVDVEHFVLKLSALMDGLSIRMLGGPRDLTRSQLLAICMAESDRWLGLAPEPRGGTRRVTTSRPPRSRS